MERNCVLLGLKGVTTKNNDVKYIAYFGDSDTAENLIGQETFQIWLEDDEYADFRKLGIGKKCTLKLKYVDYKPILKSYKI